MSERQADRLIRIALENVKDDDYTHRGFLKPIEIALKTYKTQIFAEGEQPSQSLREGSLPGGLKIAVKAMNGQKRVLKNIDPIEDNETFEDIRRANKDNILTLMKRRKPKQIHEEDKGNEQEDVKEEGQGPGEGIKLAICVCMYSQTKSMLKSTLAGIAENIANLVAYQGINPDDIGVFVMMDGIEKVDESIVGYFEQLQKSSNINLGQNIAPSLSIVQLAERAQTMTEQEINEQEMKNINNYLFNAAQLQQRNSLRFDSIRHDYFQKKQLLNLANKLKNSKKKPHYDDLNRQLQAFFLEQAKKQRKKDYQQTDEEINQLKTQTIIDQYISNLGRARPMIAKTLQKASEYCKNYLDNKDDLAYLSCFRRKIPFSPDVIQKVLERRMDGQETQQILNFHQRSLDDDEEQENNTGPTTIMNLFLCVKYKNAGKLSSHNWFFNGFCKELRPKFAILLDVGLRPEGHALLNMYKYMKQNPNIGGVCGYMSLKMQKIDEGEEIKDQQVDTLTNIALHFVDIQRTQQVQYHFAHLMDKPFEASFGFIHVLPGAFSAYNMKAIIQYDQQQDDQLLKSYFKSIDQKLANQKIVKSQMGVTNAVLRTALPDLVNSCCISIDPQSDEAMLYNQNVYLAQDRILCMGIHKKKFDMAFLPDAYAQVDPVKTVHGLLGQRKRWINGSYFAFEKVKKELSQHEKTIGCEIGLNLQIFYLSFMNALSYFSPAFFMFTVHIAMQAFRQDVLQKYLASTVSSSVLDFFTLTMDFIYVMMLLGIIFFSIHFKNGSKYFKPFIYGVSTVFGIFMIVVMAILVVDIIRGLTTGSTHLITNSGSTSNTISLSLINLLRWMLIGSLGLYFVPILVYWLLFFKIQPLCQVFMGYLSFLFYTPTYLNILNIYSLCRIDDISWGTKGLDAESTKNANLKDSWKMVKFVHVAKYVIWNVVLSAVLLTLGSSYVPRFWVTFGMVCLIGATMAIKVFIGILYMIYYKCKSPSLNENPSVECKSRIEQKMFSYREDIKKQIQNHLKDIKSQYMGLNYIFSFIQAGRTKNVAGKAVKKQAAQKQNMLSAILGIFDRPSVNEKDKKQNPKDYKKKEEIKPKRQVENPIEMLIKGNNMRSEQEEENKTFEYLPSSNEPSNLELIRKSRNKNEESGNLKQLASIDSDFNFLSQQEWMPSKDKNLDKQKFKNKPK